MRSSAPLSALAAMAALAGHSTALPNRWSVSKRTGDSASKLDDCGCAPVYKTLLRCQTPEDPGSDVRDCVCTADQGGWFSAIPDCQACLTPGSYDDGNFFDNMSRLMTQLYVSCMVPGSEIRSDGASICTGNAYHEACASLGTDGQPSWASYGVLGTDSKGNGTYVLDIAGPGAEDPEETASSSLPTGTATGTATATAEPTGTQTGTQTTETPSTETDATETVSTGTEPTQTLSTKTQTTTETLTECPQTTKCVAVPTGVTTPTGSASEPAATASDGTALPTPPIVEASAARFAGSSFVLGFVLAGAVGALTL